MGDKVLLALPVGLGHVFAICDRDDWKAIKDSFKDPHEVEIEDPNGELVTIDLFDVVSNAVVSEFDEDMETSLFAELESNGVPVFDELCYANDPDKKNREEANFFTDVMALIKKLEGRIYDTRAIGVVKSRITFHFRSVTYHVVMDAATVPPTYLFGKDDGGDLNVLSASYISDISEMLSKMPDTITLDAPQVETVQNPEEIADLAAFDEAFGVCNEDECELK
jgi:hypothetical protein